MQGSGSPQWYEEWFDRDEYEIVYSHRDEEEARKVIDLVEQASGSVAGDGIMDMGCGRGRHAIILAARGYTVVGVDLSERSIMAAKTRAVDEGVRVDFRVGDMRTRVCAACFDGAVNLFTAFGYFERDEDHRDALRAISDALVPGGWFFQDFMNPAFVRSNFVPSDCRTEGDVEIEQQRTLRAGRIQKEIILRHNGDEHRFTESVRLLELDDFRKFYVDADLSIEALYGDYDGNPYSEQSPRMILFSRKAIGLNP